MQGFKSFANRITIPFPDGFNCICGTNGSGKSNVIDAIMFVLGTSSARTIRAQKLQNLLFNGARSRKPSEFFEVVLYLDNSDNSIPNYEKEVKIARKVTRSGISVYKLNGRTVTRSKILDLLENAKISPDGHNIILQGDVTNIIEMNPMGRRSIINEISGIEEFDEKKEKASKELEKVSNRVRENMFIVAEKQRTVAKLKQEKENAEKYVELAEKLKRARASFFNKKIKETEKNIEELDKKIKEESKSVQGIEEGFSLTEKTLEEKEKELTRISDEIVKQSKKFEAARDIATLQGEIARKKDRIEVNERELARIKRENIAVKSILEQKMKGVHGTLESLITVPKKYSVALEVALGGHKHDIVVDTEETAVAGIKFLKERKIGRARFLPLDKLRERKRKECKEKIIGFAADLIKYDKKISKAIDHVLADTVITEDIDESRKIKDFRIVTLDGDLIEKSGAMIGGFYKQRSMEAIQKLQQENTLLKEEIKKFQKDVPFLQQEKPKEDEKLYEKRTAIEKELESLRKKWRDEWDKRHKASNKETNIQIEKAKLEATMDNLESEYKEFDLEGFTDFLDWSVDKLHDEVRRCISEINKLGPVNMRALEEFKIINVEFEELKKKLDKLLEEKEAIVKIFNEVETKRKEKFMETLNEVSSAFKKIYSDLTGGQGDVRLEEEGNIDTGLIIEASPPGKKVVNLDSMSGGEQTLTSLSFLFALMQRYASPFFVLDEVDAALDKANTKKIVDLVKKYSKEKQFIVITHNDFTIQEADKVFGVSMEEGVSKVFSVKMPKE